jgi:hypothetical protein
MAAGRTVDARRSWPRSVAAQPGTGGGNDSGRADSGREALVATIRRCAAWNRGRQRQRPDEQWTRGARGHDLPAAQPGTGGGNESSWTDSGRERLVSTIRRLRSLEPGAATTAAGRTVAASASRPCLTRLPGPVICRPEAEPGGRSFAPPQPPRAATEPRQRLPQRGGFRHVRLASPAADFASPAGALRLSAANCVARPRIASLPRWLCLQRRERHNETQAEGFSRPIGAVASRRAVSPRLETQRPGGRRNQPLRDAITARRPPAGGCTRRRRHGRFDLRRFPFPAPTAS